MTIEWSFAGRNLKRRSLSGAVRPVWRTAVFLMMMIALSSIAACSQHDEKKFTAGGGIELVAPCRVALAASADRDRKISELQERVRKNGGETGLDDLGWAFIDKARISFDPGYYRLAESCAVCLETRSPGDPAALLLRGHALDSLHRFREAEAIGRELVLRRGLHLDYELLGDALMEQGKISEAIAAYQSMMDLKPGPQAYSRAAHMRWLTGDLQGAIEMMTLAARAAGGGESRAWAETRLATYQLQAGNLVLALGACREALETQPDYAPALLAQARILLSDDEIAEALPKLRRAAQLNPMPDYQWTLADALRAANLVQEAAEVEQAIEQLGVESDPRTAALFLATRRVMTETALTLARREVDNRQDAYTHDALAWALCAAGRFHEARQAMKEALSVGTNEARFFLHAGVILANCGDKREARSYCRRASSIKQMLLPTEREILAQQLAAL